MENDRIKRFFENEDGMSRLDFSETDYRSHSRVCDALSAIRPNDLQVFLCGHESCAPTKTAVNALVRFYTLHYVVAGVGYLECAGKNYTVKSGNIFISYAGESVTFYPDKNKPWEYIVFSLSGILQDEAVRQMGFTRNNCVITADKATAERDFRALLESSVLYGEHSFKTLAALYTLIGNIAQTSGGKNTAALQKEKYMRRVTEFIANNLDTVKVGDIAKNCALSEEYVTRLCREKFDLSLKDLIIVYRMNAARNWLRHTKVPIGMFIGQIGYGDKKYFVRAFREIFGITPAQYRKSEQEKTR